MAGILLGITYLKANNLMLPVGIHTFWNFSIFMYGFDNVTSMPSIIILKIHEENIINGGNFGFENSIICTVLLILAISLFAYFQQRTLTFSKATLSEQESQQVR